MAAIIQPQPWTRQPQIPCQVNRAHPRAKGLVAAITNRWDAANYSVDSSKLTLNATPRGLLLGPHNISVYTLTSVPKITGAFSCFFDTLWPQGGASQAWASQGGSSSGSGWSINTANGTNFRITFGGVADYSYSTASFSVGDLVRIGVVVSGAGGTARYYVNGVFDSSRSVGTSGTPSTNLIIGAAHNGSGYVNPLISGAVGNVILHSRALTDKEALDDYLNTFEIFEPLPRKIFIGPTAGGAYTVTADAGAFSLGGQDATILKTRIVTADAGAFTLSGQDATISYLSGYILTAEAGAFTLGGQDATILKSKVVSADAGAFTLSGQDASIVYVPAGSYVLSAEAGAFTLSGQSATIYKTKRITADAGAFTLSGQSASFIYSGAPVVTEEAPRQEGIDWATIVYKTLGKDYDKPEYVYEFSNGRRFVDKKNPYA